ncbi:MAG: phosphatidylglycerophosphatase A [Moraxellaceae bacterium]|nr:MAG: phosphatidylglycerophosphatase A [Moraxellaceae bacterium]
MNNSPQHGSKHQPSAHPPQPVDFLHLSLLDKILYGLGVGLGSGLAPKAPGTVASFVVLALIPLWLWLGLLSSIVVMFVMSVIGIWICDRTAAIMQVHDDARIVWDEFAGQSIVLLPLMVFEQVNVIGVLIAFALFRLFDIWKPWPIRYADHHIGGGFGIMIDDILAGIIAAAFLYAGLIIVTNLAWI